MIIQSLEKNSFKISSKDKSLIFQKDTARKINNIKTNILAIANPENKQSSIPSTKGVFIINMPGEYEVLGIFIQAFSLFKKSLTFLAKIENISLCFIANTDKILSDQQIEELNNIDILLAKTSKNTAKIIKQIEPRILMPFGNLQNIKNLIKEIGIKPKKIDNNKLNIKKADLPDQGMDIIVFE
ncbi:hypothetical protein CL633_02095 [bacterium]|nr:hypothetical protein [bacterium]|tara:strand:+ start:279 stop:830 length:552 start_codon:yes stop_codon:yes gene_type:complete